MRLPARSASDWTAEVFITTNWNGVAYIGNRARIDRYCLPWVHSPVPFQACWATPMVTKASCTLPASIISMFWLGPSVVSSLTGMSRAPLSSLARPSP